MENSVKGQTKLKAGVEDMITSLSMMAAVTDDDFETVTVPDRRIMSAIFFPLLFEVS